MNVATHSSLSFRTTVEDREFAPDAKWLANPNYSEGTRVPLVLSVPIAVFRNEVTF